MNSYKDFIEIITSRTSWCFWNLPGHEASQAAPSRLLKMVRSGRATCQVGKSLDLLLNISYLSIIIFELDFVLCLDQPLTKSRAYRITCAERAQVRRSVWQFDVFDRALRKFRPLPCAFSSRRPLRWSLRPLNLQQVRARFRDSLRDDLFIDLFIDWLLQVDQRQTLAGATWKRRSPTWKKWRSYDLAFDSYRMTNVLKIPEISNCIRHIVVYISMAST